MRSPLPTDRRWPRLDHACRRLATLLVLAASATNALAQSGSDSTRSRLAASSEPPWNPPEVVESSRTWEKVARAPGWLLSLPFAALGQAMKGALIYTEKNDVVPKVASGVSVLQNYGVVAGPASLGDRTGTGVDFGANPPFLRGLYVAGSASTRGYNRFRGSLESNYGFIEYQSDWRPRDSFFGIGADSKEAGASNYAWKTQFARVTLRLPRRQALPMTHEILDDPATSTDNHLPWRPSLRVWAGPRDVIMLDGRENTSARVPLSVGFPSLAQEQIDTRVEHFIYGGEAAIDTRSGRPHWWKGWRGAVSGERYDQPVKAFAFHSASTPSVTFTRWSYEGEAGVSFWRDPRTIRVYGRVIDQTGVTGPGVFVLPDYAFLGGRPGLWGFEPGRFRDSDLVQTRIHYIFPIARYLETDVHAEAATVAGRIEGVRMDELETSYGFALRIRSPFAPLAWGGLDWGRESLRLRFGIGGVQ